MRKNIFGSFIPIITMLLVSIIGCVLGFKGLFIIGIVVIIPISFFIEGIICSIKKIGWIIPLVISLISFFIVIILFMNDSASIYLKYYAIVYILGYILEILVSLLINKIKNLKTRS